ncbi:hypothetical protein RFI_11913, partial [Reticulomyxa filosa]
MNGTNKSIFGHWVTFCISWLSACLLLFFANIYIYTYTYPYLFVCVCICSWPYENICSEELKLYVLIKSGLRLKIPKNHGRSPAMIEMILKLTAIQPHRRPTLHHIIFQISKILQFMQFVDWDSSLRVPRDNDHHNRNISHNSNNSTINDSKESNENKNVNTNNSNNNNDLLSTYFAMAHGNRALMPPKQQSRSAYRLLPCNDTKTSQTNDTSTSQTHQQIANKFEESFDRPSQAMQSFLTAHKTTKMKLKKSQHKS